MSVIKKKFSHLEVLRSLHNNLDNNLLLNNNNLQFNNKTNPPNFYHKINCSNKIYNMYHKHK